MKAYLSKVLSPSIISLLLVSMVVAAPTTFESDESGFSVWMPSTPSVQVHTENTPVGPVTSTTYEATDKENTYSVTVTQLPSVALMFKGESGILEQARHELLKELGAKQTSWDQSRGRLSYKTANRYGEARLLIADSKLFVINGMANKKGQKNMKTFMSSFQRKS